MSHKIDNGRATDIFVDCHKDQITVSQADSATNEVSLVWINGKESASALVELLQQLIDEMKE